MLRLGLALTLVVAVFGYERYEGYKVLQVTPQNEDQVHALEKMESVLGFEVDFWRESRQIGRYADFMVTAEQLQKVMDFWADYKVTPKVMVNDVSKIVDRSMKELQNNPPIDWAKVGDDPSQFPLNVYHTHADINAYLQAIATTYSSFVTLGSIGKSHEGRDTLYVKIGTPSANPKNSLFFDAGIHAREWIAPATALYTLNQLVTGYATTYKQLLDSIDIIIAPEVNPDGYEYSRLHERMWRKTRSGPRSGCYGVDPNRNFGFHWGDSGTSSSPCSDIYKGPSPYSEVECANLKAYLDANANTIKGYLTLHSYGEDMIYPWGYATHTYPPDVADLRALGLQAGAAIRAVHGTQYVIDNSADSLYPAAGASDDYSKSIGIKWVYTVELRPGDGDTANDHQYGFDLPASFIIATAEEAFAGFMVVANRIMTGPN